MHQARISKIVIKSNIPLNAYETGTVDKVYLNLFTLSIPIVIRLKDESPFEVYVFVLSL